MSLEESELKLRAHCSDDHNAVEFSPNVARELEKKCSFLQKQFRVKRLILSTLVATNPLRVVRGEIQSLIFYFKPHPHTSLSIFAVKKLS